LKDDVGALLAVPLEDMLKQQVISAMGKALTPKAIHIVAALPKTRSAKIVRGVIQKKYLGKPLGDTASVENPASIEAIPTQE
jgi:acetyl-CoA synthetase